MKESHPLDGLSREQREALVAEQFGMLNLVNGWQNRGVHTVDCPQTSVQYAAHSPACETTQETVVPYLTKEQIQSLPTRGSGGASSAEAY